VLVQLLQLLVRLLTRENVLTLLLVILLLNIS
jgi:hypothetical protein